MSQFKKYKVQLKYPLNENTEAALYNTGALPYGEEGEEEIVVVTFMEKEELLDKCEVDIKKITAELNFDYEEQTYIEKIKEEFGINSRDEFLRYYYFAY